MLLGSLECLFSTDGFVFVFFLQALPKANVGAKNFPQTNIFFEHN